MTSKGPPAGAPVHQPWLQVLTGSPPTSAGGRYGEGNPLVAATFGHLGVGPRSGRREVHACGCLLLIWHLRCRRSSPPRRLPTAITYLLASVAPWLGVRDA
jgi:hypothetical protein